jgi:hypothetical protein
MSVNNIEELAKELGVAINGIEKAVYKNTDCGAWIKILDDGIKLGSIVEDSDAETETYILKFPFTIDKFWNTLGEIECEADILWHEAND